MNKEIGSRHERWIKLALKKAAENPYPGYKMSAVCVRGGRVLAIGYNKLQPGILKSNLYHQKAVHAELNLVLQIDPKLLRGSTVYVAGFSKGKNSIKSAPCPLCMQTLKNAGIKTVVYHEVSGELSMLRIA